jgi:hypothetical protein
MTSSPRCAASDELLLTIEIRADGDTTTILVAALSLAGDDRGAE